jgi:hypothetical protein
MGTKFTWAAGIARRKMPLSRSEIKRRYARYGKHSLIPISFKQCDSYRPGKHATDPAKNATPGKLRLRLAVRCRGSRRLSRCPALSPIDPIVFEAEGDQNVQRNARIWGMSVQDDRRSNGASSIVMRPHAINLFDMHQKYADVLGIDEVVGHLDSLRPQAAVPA